MEARVWTARIPFERRREHERRQQSFSSSLLDAIYRSIDDSDAGKPTPARPFRRSPDPSIYCKARHPHHRESSGRDTYDLPGTLRTVSKQQRYYYNYTHRRPAASSSSSSEGSSYGGFSSSDAESACTARPAPIRTSSLVELPRSALDQEKKQATSIRSRIRDLRKARPPVSPGARLASFITSLFAAGASPKKPKVSPAPAGPDSASACSSASSFSRSCLSKTPSSRGRAEEKRSVRFGAVSVIAVPGDEKQSRGQKRCYSRSPPQPQPQPQPRVKEILRDPDDAETKYEEESDDVASDTSSDLFELENLTASSWEGGAYGDELPVYETTHFPASLALSRGLVR